MDVVREEAVKLIELVPRNVNLMRLNQQSGERLEQAEQMWKAHDTTEIKRNFHVLSVLFHLNTIISFCSSSK